MNENLQFILDRLKESAAREDTEDSEGLNEAEALYQELNALDDDELIEAGIHCGVIDPADLEEDGKDDDADDEIDPEDIDVEALCDYANETGEELAEAQEIIEQLVKHLEEAGDYEDVVLKYETALGIIQETAAHYQLLQEAVGGQEKASDLIEAHIQTLEAAEGNEEAGADSVTEDIDNDDAKVLDKVFEEAGADNDRVNKSVALWESAQNRFGALN